MVYSLIRNHIETLGEAFKKGLPLEVLQQITLVNRAHLHYITRYPEFDSVIWNKVLSSRTLIQIVNEQTVQDKLVRFLCSSNRPLEQIERMIQTEGVEDIYELFEDGRFSVYHQWARSDLFIDIMECYSDRAYLAQNMEECIGPFIENMQHYDSREKYSTLSELERPVAIRMSKYTKPLHFSLISLTRHIEFYEQLEQFMSREDIVDCIRGLEATFKAADDPEEITRGILEMYATAAPDLVNAWITQLWSNWLNPPTEFQYRALFQHASTRKEQDVYEVIYGSNSLAVQAWDLCKDGGDHLKRFIHRCAEQGKKAFLKIVVNNEAVHRHIRRLDKFHPIFSDHFLNVINVNTLQVSDFKMSMHQLKGDTLIKYISGKGLCVTWKEFKFLYKQNDLNVDLYFRLVDLGISVDKRLQLCRELPVLNTLTQHFDSEESLLTALVSLIQKGNFKDQLQKQSWYVKGAEDSQYLLMLLQPERFERFSEYVTSPYDIRFIVSEYTLLEQSSNFTDAKRLYLATNLDCQDLIEALKLPAEFKEKHMDEIISFCFKGLAKVFLKMMGSSELSSRQKQNLVLLTKAEIMSNLKEVKFVETDFELEIGLPITEAAIDEWKRDRQMKMAGSLVMAEAADYETTIRVGQYPVSTCLHWNKGMYQRCLLSSFDTNKKMITVHNSKQQYVGRAVIRLTKAISHLPKKKLRFKDITKQETEVPAQPVEERFILFLERCYSTTDGDVARCVREGIIKMAKKKAEMMGATLVVSTSYGRADFPEELSFVETKKNLVFISHSKNEYQYLDSMSGQASEANEGKYVRTELWSEGPLFTQEQETTSSDVE